MAPLQDFQFQVDDFCFFPKKELSFQKRNWDYWWKFFWVMIKYIEEEDSGAPGLKRGSFGTWVVH